MFLSLKPKDHYKEIDLFEFLIRHRFEILQVGHQLYQEFTFLPQTSVDYVQIMIDFCHTNPYRLNMNIFGTQFYKTRSSVIYGMLKWGQHSKGEI